MLPEDLKESIMDLCHAVKLLAVVTKNAAYAALAKDDDQIQKMTRHVEHVSNIADKALQRLARDIDSLENYPPSAPHSSDQWPPG